MHTDMSLLALVMGASLPVKIVMLILLGASVVSWSIIFSKARLISSTKDASDRFEANFWSGGDLQTLYASATRQKGGNAGMSSIFESGFREFNRSTQQDDVQADKLVEECRRAMRVSMMREVDRLEQGLATLATIGSTSPYVGLFGTVWGIMTSFQAIANSKNTALAVVAPGIAEALLATALGLLAAIPAVIAYNKLSSEAGKIGQRLESFADEFSAILSRQVDEKV
jgi:biopolymer transport protein TolQ